jgi:hypothetical protein
MTNGSNVVCPGPMEIRRAGTTPGMRANTTSMPLIVDGTACEVELDALRDAEKAHTKA